MHPLHLSHRGARCGFTLIELLVVIALIAVLAGGIGLGLGRGNSSVALQNSQASLISSLSGVRAQAALNQASAAVFVNVSPSSDGFLRELRVATSLDHDNNPVTAAIWSVEGDPILFSSGIYLVPPASELTADVEYKPAATDWTNAHSTAYLTTGGDITLKYSDNTNVSSDKYRRLVMLSPTGATTAGRLILAVGEPKPGGQGVTFANPEALRGARISSYGVATMVVGQEAFNN